MPRQWPIQFWQSLEEGAGKLISAYASNTFFCVKLQVSVSGRTATCFTAFALNFV